MNFTKEFEEFFTSLNDFEESYVLWCLVLNPECPIETFLIILDRINEKTFENKVRFTDNYINSLTKDYSLKDFTRKEADYLREKLKTLDGTLLMDIISETLRTHKIFI